MSDRAQDDTMALRRVFLHLGVQGLLYSAAGTGLVWTGNFVAALVGSVLFVAGSLMLIAVILGAPLVNFLLWDTHHDPRRRTSSEESRNG